MWADGWAWVGWVSGLAGLVLLAVGAGVRKVRERERRPPSRGWGRG